jgi:hypothetical protein
VAPIATVSLGAFGKHQVVEVIGARSTGGRNKESGLGRSVQGGFTAVISDVYRDRRWLAHHKIGLLNMFYYDGRARHEALSEILV